MNQSQQSAKVGTFHAVPYPLTGRENQSIDRAPVAKEPLSVNLSQEQKDEFSGNVLIQFKDGKILAVLRPPRKPVFVDTAKLVRMIAQAEHRINDHTQKLEKFKAGGLYSEAERVQKTINESRKNISAWKREIETAEAAEKDYQDALSELAVRIKAAAR